jgi:hypothetical protein
MCTSLGSVLKLGDDRYETKCASCMRASPVMPGPLADAEAKLKSLGWYNDVDACWHCPICTARSTTKRKRFEG